MRLPETRRSRFLLLAILAALALAGLPAAGSDAAGAENVTSADLCVYGGTSAGIAAAIQMHRLGGTALVVEPGRYLGGMTAGGLGHTDIGNRGAIGGLAREFYGRIHQHYVRKYGPGSQQVRDCFDGFRFEPHVAALTFEAMLQEASVPVFVEQRLKTVRKQGNRIVEIETESGRVFRARAFIDATYEGDLMAKAGVSYTIGREANAQYGETLNGVQFGHPHHNFRVFVDPYVKEGDPSSGLLKGIAPGDGGVQGEGDRKIQAYNFRMCLTNVPENRIHFRKPENYDPDRYTLLARYIKAGIFDALHLSTPVPNGKTDTNNFGAFSTDHIGANYAYPEGDYATRERIYRDHVEYQQGLMWFLMQDERVPLRIREQVAQWGLAKDEFLTTGGWPHALYVREARRMVSDYVMTEHHCRGRAVADDSVGLAAYGMDSHHVQRVVRNGRVVNEGDVQVGGFPPYPIAYRAIVPRENECGNLLVPVCLSASHIAYGSIRMEPVFMTLAQSAATAAYLSLAAGVPVQRVDLPQLQARLRADGQVLTWTVVQSAAAPMREAPTAPPPEAEPSAPPAVASPAGTASASPAFDPGTLQGILLDEGDALQIGQWVPSSLTALRRVGTGYVHDGNDQKGRLSIVYTPDLPEEGGYEIVLAFVPNSNRASNVPVTVAVEGVGSVTVTVDQRSEEGSGFASLGIYKLPRGKRTTVTISNRNTDGFVVADGIQFIPVPASTGTAR